ncbi:MAG TPA: tRNA 2-selenouridine(34) synthase MnmH [Casimicrobiaceae bacterium]|nr:tRNA 2-selenouridine(34) synthase MnmH [Casimicrobiaceae bacterium]
MASAETAARHAALATVGPDAIGDYATIIDVRSPAEYADDHVPGAVNYPVLDDDERARVGTLHVQHCAFEARKVGAALITRNIARIVTSWRDEPRSFAPLVYCWRGGQRSRALSIVMREIGWRAVQLAGGYRAYRRHVLAALDSLPQRFRFNVVCGLTGSGKSRLLAALAAEGAQVLDLERLAAHRGSLLGDLPDAPQPSQKRFDSLVLDALRRFDVSRPVYVESESRKIGRLQVPAALLQAMRGAHCVSVDLPLALRVGLLQQEYAHFVRDPDLLRKRLAPLLPLVGKATIDRWHALAVDGAHDRLVEALLTEHYDPTYLRAIDRNFPNLAHARKVVPASITPDAFRATARELIADR